MGRQFLSNLRDFREEHVHQETQHVNSPLQHGKSNLGSRGGQGELLRRFISRDVVRASHNDGSLWMINPQQRTHPYLLDWYYMAQPLQQVDNQQSSVLPSETQDAATGIFWPLNVSIRSKNVVEENWNHPPETLQDNFEPSSSKHLTHDSIFHRSDSGGPEDQTESHWWDRSRPCTAGPETSFLEPPVFRYQNFTGGAGISSEISEEQEEEEDSHTNLRKSHTFLTRTMYLDGCEEEAFSLPFNDIYTGSSQNLPFKSDTTDNDIP